MDFMGDGGSWEAIQRQWGYPKIGKNQSSHHFQAERQRSQRYNGNPWLWVTRWRLQLVGFSGRNWNLESESSHCKGRKRSSLAFSFLLQMVLEPGKSRLKGSAPPWIQSRTEDKGKRDQSRHKGHAIQVVSKSRDRFVMNNPCCLSWESLTLTVLILWDSKRETCSNNVRAPWSLNQWQLFHWSIIASCQRDQAT